MQRILYIKDSREVVEMMKLLENKNFMPCLKKVIAFICFLAIFISVFTSVTYLFRGNQFNTFNNDRLSIIGIKEEDSLDMVYIGGSAAFCYWIPLQAWNDCGFTSYDLTSTSIQAENILYLVKHALKYQDPELFVIGVRSFAYYTDEGYEAGLRYVSDSLDLGLDRIQLARTYFRHRNIDTDICSVYFDIIKHHINYDALASPEIWNLMDNTAEHPEKGCHLLTSYYYLDEPEPFQTEQRAELPQGASDTLYELLDFCTEEDLNVLFVVCPYAVAEEEYELYNTMEDIITSYGFGFLNANDYYDVMDLDFSKDFADKGHVSALGAEKYTAFLGNYIVENYGLTDHRNEGNAAWEESYAQSADAAKETKAALEDMIALAQDGKAIARELCDTDDLALWCDLVKDPRFTVLAVGDGESLGKLSYIDQKALEATGLTDMEGDNYIRVLCDSEVLYTNEGSDESRCEIDIGAQRNIGCVIDNTEQLSSIMIDGEEYCRKDDKGIHIVIFENDYRYVVDSFTVQSDVDGNVEFVR